MHKRKVIAIIMAFVLFFAVGGVLPAQSTPGTVFAADDQPEIIRIGGKDRFETNVRIVEQEWQHADTVIIVRGTGEGMFADAMSAGLLAYQYNAPILLVDRRSIPKPIGDLLTKLRPTNAFVIGGTGVVSDEVVQQLKARNIKVERIWGTDRRETAVKVGDKVKEKVNFNTVIIATGLNFPDALSAAPFSAMYNMPILFVTGNKLDTLTKDAIKRWGIKKAIIVGGPSVVPVSVQNELLSIIPPIEVVRVGSRDRYETSLEIVRYFDYDNFEGITFATGKNYPDSLAGVVFAAKRKAPIIITDPSVNTDNANEYILQKGYKKSYVLGDRGIMPDTLINRLLAKRNIPAEPPAEPPANQGNLFDNVPSYGRAVARNGWVYYSNITFTREGQHVPIADEGIFRMKDDGTNVQKLVSCSGMYLNVIDDWLYYYDWQNRTFCRIKTDGSSKPEVVLDKTVLGEFASQEIIVDDWLYYSSNSSLYRVRLDGTQKKLLVPAICSIVNIIDNKIYFDRAITGPDDADLAGLYVMNLDGTDIKAINEKDASVMNITKDYVFFFRDFHIFRAPYSNWADKQEICYGDIGFSFIIGQYMYFNAWHDLNNLYKMKIDGTGKTRLTNYTTRRDLTHMNAAGNWIFFDDDSSQRVFMVRRDGKEEKYIS